MILSSFIFNQVLPIFLLSRLFSFEKFDESRLKFERLAYELCMKYNIRRTMIINTF